MSVIWGNSFGGGGGAFANINVYGLQQTDSVVATKGSKTKNGVWKSVPNPAHVVPDGYTQYVSITSHRAEWIDTAVSITSDIYVKLVAKNADTSGTAQFLIGSSNSNAGGWMNSNRTTSSESYHYRNYYVSNKICSADLSFKADSRTFEMTPSSFIIDGVNATQASDSGNTNSGNVTIFATGTNLSTHEFGTVEFNSLEIQKNNVVVAYMIPCKRNSDNAIGVYDTVRNLFIANGGTGTFTVGEEVPQTIDSFQIGHISDFGTWSVTATSGVKTKTISINVDTVREYDVEWSWKLYLYNLGDECENITGGWTSTGYTYSGVTINNTNVVKNTSSISVGGYASRVSVIGTTNMVDLTNYTKLYYTLNHNTANNPWLGILNGKDVNTNRVTRVLPADTGDVTYYIDVSSYSTSYYIVVPNTQQSASSTGYFTKVWLE